MILRIALEFVNRMLPLPRSLLVTLLLALLAGCSSAPKIDHSYPSVNHDSRVQFVVMHFTAASLPRSWPCSPMVKSVRTT